MSKARHSLLAGIQERIGEFSIDLAELIQLRVELAKLELEADVESGKRLAILLGTCAVMALTGLPLLVAALAWSLDGCLGLAMGGWLLLFGIGLLAVAGGLGYWSWLQFRKSFTALRQTREELMEDLEWFREWRGKSDGDSSAAKPSP